jgi:cytochrome c oxidase subunit 2
MTNVFDVTPTRTGSFTGRCAQFCGLDHALMSFAVHVVPRSAYDRFVASNGASVP